MKDKQMSVEKRRSQRETTENPRALSDDELKQVTGGLDWGPFNDAVVPCCWCGKNNIVYKDRDINCYSCGGLLRASLYE